MIDLVELKKQKMMHHGTENLSLEVNDIKREQNALKGPIMSRVDTALRESMNERMLKCSMARDGIICDQRKIENETKDLENLIEVN